MATNGRDVSDTLTTSKWPVSEHRAWERDFYAIHGRKPEQNDVEDRNWSVAYAEQHGGIAPTREKWKEHYHSLSRVEQRERKKEQRAAGGEFVEYEDAQLNLGTAAEPNWVTPFPWEAAVDPGDEKGVWEQYYKWDAERGGYKRGSAEWDEHTAKMNQLITSTRRGGASWLVNFKPEYRDQARGIAAGRNPYERVAELNRWRQYMKDQGIDVFTRGAFNQRYGAPPSRAGNVEVATGPTADAQTGAIATGVTPDGTTVLPSDQQSPKGLTEEEQQALARAAAGMWEETKLVDRPTQEAGPPVVSKGVGGAGDLMQPPPTNYIRPGMVGPTGPQGQANVTPDADRLYRPSNTVAGTGGVPSDTARLYRQSNTGAGTPAVTQPGSLEEELRHNFPQLTDAQIAELIETSAAEATGRPSAQVPGEVPAWRKYSPAGLAQMGLLGLGQHLDSIPPTDARRALSPASLGWQATNALRQLLAGASDRGGRGGQVGGRTPGQGVTVGRPMDPLGLLRALQAGGTEDRGGGRGGRTGSTPLPNVYDALYPPVEQPPPSGATDTIEPYVEPSAQVLPAEALTQTLATGVTPEGKAQVQPGALERVLGLVAELPLGAQQALTQILSTGRPGYEGPGPVSVGTPGAAGLMQSPAAKHQAEWLRYLGGQNAILMNEDQRGRRLAIPR